MDGSPKIEIKPLIWNAALNTGQFQTRLYEGQTREILKTGAVRADDKIVVVKIRTAE